MRVSRRSWHWRMHVFLYTLWAEGPEAFTGARHEPKPPKNLCSYFWKTAALVATLPVWLAIVIVLFVAGAVYMGWMRFVRRPWLRRRAARRRRKGDEPRDEQPPKEKRPSLVAEYVKARKAKVCPMIEMVD